jgi:hypothetical protein
MAAFSGSARNREAQTVKNGFAAKLDDIGRNVGRLCARDEFRNMAGQRGQGFIIG